eukprot:scaffold4990_cov387-Prasinococcus_capsulatus_cf.AAC.9
MAVMRADHPERAPLLGQSERDEPERSSGPRRRMPTPPPPPPSPPDQRPLSREAGAGRTVTGDDREASYSPATA